MCGDGEAISLTRTCVSESGFKELGVIIDSLDSFRYLVHYFDNVPTQIRHRNLKFFLSFFLFESDSLYHRGLHRPNGIWSCSRVKKLDRRWVLLPFVSVFGSE